MNKEEKSQLLIHYILEAASGNHTAFYELATETEQPDEIDAIGIAFNSLLEEFRAEAEKKERDMLGWRRAMHDIRGPIGSIKVLSGVLKQNLEKQTLHTETGIKSLSAIIASTELMLEKLNFALDSRRQSNPRITLIDIRSLVDEALKLLMLEIQTSEFRVFVNVAPDFLLNSDRELLVSIFKNLIENSYKYRRSNYPGAVSIYARSDGSEAAITLSDDGRGISEDRIDTIFEMHEREHTDQDGVGYGLYSVKRDIETLHGKIYLSSDIGVGTRIELRFPAVYPDTLMKGFTNVRHDKQEGKNGNS